jgi:hypothetical protein
MCEHPQFSVIIPFLKARTCDLVTRLVHLMRYIIFAIVPVMLAAYVALIHVAEKRLRRRLGGRPVLPFDPWYDQYYGKWGADREVVRCVHDALAEDLGVHATQILPTDRFDVELTCPEWWGPGSIQLAVFDSVMEGFLDERGVNQCDVPPCICNTVGEYISEICSILASRASERGE